MKGKGKTWGKFDRNTRRRHAREDREMSRKVAVSNREVRESFKNLLKSLPGGIAALLILGGLVFGIGYGIYKLYQWIFT